MKIESSSIAMATMTSFYKSSRTEESLRAWVGNARPDFERLEQTNGTPPLNQEDILDLSEEAKEFLRQGAASSVNKTGSLPGDEEVLSISEQDNMKIRLLQRMLEALTGKKIRFYGLGIKLKKTDISINVQARQQQPQQQQLGWGLEYDRHESYLEKESMSYAARGVIKTADGREIDFSVNLNMSREFAVQNNISIRAGDAMVKDPLVINFDGAPLSLTDTKFSFDLDADGDDENISFVRPGSGFLALDLNGDNRINSGAELFGPASGNGFAELSQYDEDGNNWIDENDSIFSRLRIWTKDEAGNDVLFALGQKGVGAIYLGNASSLFSVKDAGNNLQGQIQRTGIFINENGTAGTVQQVDLVVE